MSDGGGTEISSLRCEVVDREELYAVLLDALDVEMPCLHTRTRESSDRLSSHLFSRGSNIPSLRISFEREPLCVVTATVRHSQACIPYLRGTAGDVIDLERLHAVRLDVLDVEVALLDRLEARLALGVPQDFPLGVLESEEHQKYSSSSNKALSARVFCLNFLWRGWSDN